MTDASGINLSRELFVATCAPDIEVARRSWATICERFDSPMKFINGLNGQPASRLLPLLHARRLSLHIDTTIAEYLAGAVVESWGFNLRLFERAAPVIEALHEVGIELTALKGFSLIGDAYPTHELRPMGDVDILIRPEEVGMARRILESHGWYLGTPKWPVRRLQHWAYTNGSHSYPFSVLGSFIIDLHWRGARELAAHPEAVTRSTVPLATGHPFGHLHVRRPDAEWTVIILAMHASQARNSNLIHPLADIVRYLDIGASGVRRPIDWERVHFLASNELVALRVRRVLGDLFELLSVGEHSPDVRFPSVDRRHVRRERRAIEADVRQNVDYTGSKLNRLLIQLRHGTRAETPALGPFRTLKVFLARTMIATENAVVLRRRRHLNR